MHYRKKLESLCKGKEELLSSKLEDLFSYQKEESYAIRFNEILERLYDYNKKTRRDYEAGIDRGMILLVLIDGMIELEKFWKLSGDEKHFNYKTIEKKFEEIKPYILSDSSIIIDIPYHPRDIYSNCYSHIATPVTGGLSDKKAKEVINIALSEGRRRPMSVDSKKELSSLKLLLKKCYVSDLSKEEEIEFYRLLNRHKFI